MQILLFTAMLSLGAWGDEATIRHVEVYQADAARQTESVLSDAQAIPTRRNMHARPKIAVVKSGAAVSSQPFCNRQGYLAVRASYFTGPYDYRKQFDYAWHSTPYPSLPAMSRYMPGGIEPIPTPPPE